MVDGTLRWVLRHEKRPLIVITLTFVTGLLVVMPAVEDYSAAKERSKTAREKLDEIKRQVQNLPQLQQTFERNKRQLKTLEAKAVTEKNVEQLRDTLAKLIRETGCTQRLLSIDTSPTLKTWMTNDSALGRKAYVDPGPETKYLLANRNAKLAIEGAMANVYQFMARVSQLDRFMHVKRVRLERSARDENVTELEMEFELFDLTRKTVAKS
jgi:Tfp pilus assembly protein PilO